MQLPKARTQFSDGTHPSYILTPTYGYARRSAPEGSLVSLSVRERLKMCWNPSLQRYPTRANLGSKSLRCISPLPQSGRRVEAYPLLNSTKFCAPVSNVRLKRCAAMCGFSAFSRFCCIMGPKGSNMSTNFRSDFVRCLTAARACHKLT